MREAGFIDGQVLKTVHLSAGSDDDDDGSTSHVTCTAAQLNPDAAQPLRVPTAPSYAVANILFQLQGGCLPGGAGALVFDVVCRLEPVSCSACPAAVAGGMPRVTCDV